MYNNMAQDKTSLQERIRGIRAAIVHPLPNWSPTKEEVVDLLADIDEYITQTLSPEKLADELGDITEEITDAHDQMIYSIRSATLLKERLRKTNFRTRSEDMALAAIEDIINKASKADEHIGNAGAKIAIIDF